MPPLSVRCAPPIDAIILNAGGPGGQAANAQNEHGVTNIFANNILGHVVLVDELLERQLLTSTVLYAGSEAARGIAKMGIAKPELKNFSVEEFTAIINGRKFAPNDDLFYIYGTIKLIGGLWMASMARQNPQIRFITMSPGGTAGTNGADGLPFLKRVMFKYIGGPLMPVFGMMHSVEKGAKRYVDGLLNPKFESGNFYASRAGWPTGPVVDQSTIDALFANLTAQENAIRAIRKFA